MKEVVWYQFTDINTRKRSAHFVMIAVARKIIVVDPNVTRCLDTNRVPSGCQDLADFDIADDH